ncbi:MAG TPA: nicotinamide riboside transporter PnuC [Chitinophagaceae bacterium]|nr:nicotinamide riboside transporter PnuC [Chitinophagaceae bacterium]MCC6634595.1 nicotinamide mononucleotide transporter [Chitinophagaceae bacterium]HMZ46826.1 nicotinamide riboside transporter PnuC [Chitinophagaceae bacterium]HNE92596.1 nicotinamide riboside transporter PnuC [Chitinophagaceae bacterium]HNF28722.1 nicotinamide riboside transporter PnuC [Chitinophagaceae bacterium]
MTFEIFTQQLVSGVQQTQWYELVAVFAGIASVWFSRKENILVYPVGLINTIMYVYISFKHHLLGEATVNFYYTIMSIYGWWLWTRKDKQSHEIVLHISYSTKKEWIEQLCFFAVVFAICFTALHLAKQYFFEGVIPAADAFATATAFTGMWLMAKKKVESWWWWIATNITSIPLYFVKSLVFTSVQYIVLLVLAIAGLITWMKKAKAENKY